MPPMLSNLHLTGGMRGLTRFLELHCPDLEKDTYVVMIYRSNV